MSDEPKRVPGGDAADAVSPDSTGALSHDPSHSRPPSRHASPAAHDSSSAARQSSSDARRAPSVSVVVPSYNHEPFVERALRSVFAQTRAPLELIVIDDGSSDDSPGRIERALKDCPFACEFVARGANRGLSATLNEGFARTGGDYFAYLGSDDLWLPEFLEARIELLESRPRAVLAYGNAYTVDAEDRIVDCTSDWARYRDGDVRRMLLTTLAPLSPTVVYRRAALGAYLWNESARLEDYELYLRLSADGEFAFDPRVLSAWRVHGRNASENIAMMLEERLAAQRAAAPALGLSGEEVKNFQALARFRGAEEFVRRGEKLRAVRLTLGNLRGVPSAREAARMLARVLTPHRLLLWRRERARRRAHARYGSLRL